MDQSTKNAKLATPTKCLQGVRLTGSENSNPNVTSPGLTQKHSKSPLLPKSSGKLQKSAPRNPNALLASPRIRIRERKFVVPKKKKKTNSEDNAAKDVKVNPNCKCKDRVNGKCLCIAYETLRASQEEFFKSWKEEVVIGEIGAEDCENESDPRFENPEQEDCLGVNQPARNESPNGSADSSGSKRRRDKLMEKARESIPEPGSGRVLNLVHAFEKLLTIPKDSENKDEKEQEEDIKNAAKWALPGLQKPKAFVTPESSSFCPEEFVLTAENLGLDSHFTSSSDSQQSLRSSTGRRSSTGSLRSHRSNSVPSGNAGERKLKKKQVKVTYQKPFKLRTEERGKEKEEEFFKKLQEIIIQEEKQRIPIAQGLPWTTDEPEILIKPSVKDITRPLDIKLHTDIRAVDRADFDHQVAEKMSLIEQYRMERERQLKLAEEEEVKRLRKELVPKAQPMPYFDRPFLPKRSVKQPTIPKEPKFHAPQHKKLRPCISWNEFSNLCPQHQC
ncbi:hypothetical protein V2J09_024146 [Rumex salicifolius]